MEIATTSNALDLFPKNRRVKTKGVRYNFIDFSSLLPVNPKSDLDKSQSLSQTKRDGKYDVVVAAPKKRQRSGEENPPQKKQKKTETKTKVTKSVDAKAVTRTITKPENSTTASSETRLHETETKPEGIDLRNLITKAQHKIQEKRQIDHRREDIARQRIAARIALNQMVATVSFDHHMNYHRELEQLGCTFIHDQVDCLNMFNLWSRSDYNGVTNSVFKKNKTPWCDEDF